ncbi:aromatic ring-hydroxylating dioxygenase subunit alpha [Sphingomonas sp. CGMCC 1.13654]|uniref:Aromatic ring-hydroxylating dioxygenase subunit alpha n=1 Tax=Sphingomonas chungangi TaxID=2683589 RepID=A0A838L3J2_9SPHN|nr:aromatic ring-hydroxylating dioxygenase subunit alpha [Sphingomonas chungangi]MBA2933754.1 aromatic ring-hydroxylating dioxygenase subunit alpha [Sphingomonas chungangi]MVW55085.1 Rieske 2Fe-2S domain-containing protein [Sphingomonas chungangi]
MDQPTPRDLLTPGQQKLLEAMPALDEIRLPEVRDSIPASHYTDPARFDAEMASIFRKVPVIAGPSALLPKPREYASVDIVGMPVLLTRTKDGTAKAFANVCRHRGMKLCLSKDPVSAGRLVCPYHAWTYDLEGRLIGLPRSETFPGLEKSQLGLKELPCSEAGGLIWVGLDPDSPPDFSTVEGELAADLDAFSMKDLFLFDHATFKVEANWKLLMDSMLDSYHVTRLHKDSLAQFSVDSENMIDRIGPHIRNAAHRGNFDKAAITDRFGAMRKMMVFSYIGFPNGIIVVSPHYISLGVVRPVDNQRTEIDYYQLYDAPPRDERYAGKMREAFDLMERVFAKEDYWAAEMCDKGLRSGTLEEVQLGGMEVQIRMFQDAVTECLEAHAA